MRLDILALTGEELGLSELSMHWPTINESYQPWSFTYPVRIHVVIENSSDWEVRVAVNAVFSDIARDASRIACAAVDIQEAGKKGAEIILHEGISPIAAWLNSDASLPRKIYDIHPGCAPVKPGKKNWRTPLRVLKRSATTLLTRADRRVDIQSINDIVSRVVANDDARIPVVLYPDLLPFTNPGQFVPGVRDVTEVLIEEFREHLLSLNGLTMSLVNRCALMFGLFLRERVGQAYGDFCAYKAWRRGKRISGSLLGGTPKVSGRLLGKLYRDEERQVSRCTHGGDRGFFDDPLWAFSELQEADEYWVHGPKEALNITQRLAHQRIVRPSFVPKIRAAGSPTHVARFRSGHECRRLRGDGKRVVLVAGLFSGEWNHLTIAFKPPDPLIADLQIFLLRILKMGGHYVMVRPHPKGLLPRLKMVESFYRPHCDEILTGPFDSMNVDADVLIFDFAGSAWFDALSSHRGVLLVDTGDRPFDPEGMDDLKERCAVVKAKRVFQGGYRFNPEEIESGIEEAMSKAICTEEFAEKYFGLSLVPCP